MSANQGSILDDTKQLLGLPPGYVAFDLDVLLHINSALGTLIELGIGPQAGYEITGSEQTWTDFEPDPRFSSMKSYVYLRVRLLFDPPTLGAHMDALKNQIEVLEVRLRNQKEAIEWAASHPAPTPSP